MNDFHSVRSRIIQIIFAAVFVLIILQLFNLQVLNSKYKLMADDQAIYRKVIYPSRGLIIDRKKKVILDNTTLFDLVVVPAQLRNGCDTATLCSILNINEEEFKKRIINSIVKNGRYQASVFEALLDEKTHAQLAEKLPNFQPAFDLVERPVRKYPYEAAAHVFGYLAEVDPKFLEKYGSEGYRQGDYAGMTGLERTYEKVLMGQRGIQYWNRDNKNRPTQPYQGGRFDTSAVAGSTLYSSLDIELQELGELLMSGKMGSVVAIDPKTGGILAMVSAPSYSPRLLTGNQRRKHFSELYTNPRLPLINRAISGEYSPGSTFKTLQALVGMQEGVITDMTGYPCRGAYYDCGTGRPKCHGSNHAPDLEHAIAQSCNPYFANVYRKILENPKYPNVDSSLSVWDRYMYSFGLGHKLGVDLPSEKGGYIPTPKRYQKVFGPRWHACNTISNSIGQGEVNSTILQLANAIAMIANKGWYYTPHLVDSIEGGDRYGLLEPYRKKIEPIHIPDHMFEAVHAGMEAVMKPGGTGWRLAVEGINICGKTGTVENYYKGSKQKDHSFFAAFAPRENPKIAIACIVENGGFGATIAAPIVSLMIEKYINDTISTARQEWVKRYSSMSITPARILDEIRKRDSIKLVKDAERARKELMKKIKEETGIEEDPESNTTEPARKTPPTPKADSNRTTALITDDKRKWAPWPTLS
ncbi:MAG: penicillin-binding protein 2 [Chitinophagaceae bacterium]|jgi:penicillin-binding protein 2|nr:penicillin-binding protein 2 [Chitinophagaceae bacterium]